MVYRSDRESKSPETEVSGRPFYQNEPELTRLALKQMRELELTAIPSDKDSGFVLMKLCDISALHEEILVGKGYNEITLHDINLLSMSKSLWKWAKIVSDHEGIQELKKELVLDHSRFGMDGVTCSVTDKPEDTQTSWTGQAQSNPFSNKESVGPSMQLVASMLLGN